MENQEVVTELQKESAHPPKKVVDIEINIQIFSNGHGHYLTTIKYGDQIIEKQIAELLKNQLSELKEKFEHPGLKHYF